VSACTVVIGHREAIVAEGLAAALARCPGIVPIGTANSPGEVIRLGQKAVAVAVDAEMRDAESVAGTLRRCGVRVVFLGSNGSDDESVRVSTDGRVATLAAALNPRAGAPHRPGSILTGREREVLLLVAMGLAGKQVARHLGISPKTVERHKTKIFSKLGVPNAAAAVGLLLSTNGGGAAWTRSII
jgi:DNA-binding CsgD family transcriptional regulator